jgi:Sulfotransferase domain
MLPPLVICDGIFRSGSTWSFNVCLQLAALRAGRSGEPLLSDYINEAQLEDFIRLKAAARPGPIVYKAHFVGPLAREWIRTGRAKSICTLRDPRDCVASDIAFMKGSFDEAVERVAVSLKTLEASVDYGRTLFIRYEDMMSDRLAQIQLIAAYLNIRIDEKQLEWIDAQTNIETSRVISAQVLATGESEAEKLGLRPRHATTLLHDNHIGSALVGRWKLDLSPAQGRQLTHLFQKSSTISLKPLEARRLAWIDPLIDRPSESVESAGEQSYYFLTGALGGE